MGALAHYQYDYYEPAGFKPGEERILPFNWYRKAVVATAQPFDLSTSDRRLIVTAIGLRTIPDQYATWAEIL